MGAAIGGRSNASAAGAPGSSTALTADVPAIAAAAPTPTAMPASLRAADPSASALCGSSRCASASPAAANEKTTMPSAMPGNRDGHQMPMIMLCAPVDTMLPSSGVGGLTPAPTKLRPAVSRMAKPIVAEIWATSGGKAFGRRCRKAIERSVAPTDSAASANGRSRSERISAREMRRNTGMFTNAMAMMMFSVDAPRTATRTIARMNTGNAWMTSSRRRMPSPRIDAERRREFSK